MIALGLLSACGSGQNFSCDTDEGRRAIVQEVDNALSEQSCAEALAIVEIYYPQAGCASDEMRLARASANACAANINFFKLVGDLGANNLAGNELWVTLTKIFPSSLVDQRVTAGQNALDALFAIRLPGVLSPPEAIVNKSSANPGTLVAGHRPFDANLYSLFVSMSLIGSLQNRYGAPLPNFHRGQKLGVSGLYPNGWETVAAVDVNACTYAGALLTFFDSVNQVGPTIGSSLGGSIGPALVTAASVLSTAVNAACDAGCTSCGMPAGSCSVCPIELRNRFSCTGLATDKASCAAAGIISFMNSTPGGPGWPN